jgi:hypothetical protein
VSFGKALGQMHENIMDVHGAGSQRSDPKAGQPMSRGPQGDYIRVDNYVRSVRGGYGDFAAQANTQPQSEKINEYTVASETVSTSSQVRSRNQTQNHNKNLNQSNKFINRFDKDGDGKVSASEFTAGTKRFNHLDKNKDGYITVNEAPTGPPKATK